MKSKATRGLTKSGKRRGRPPKYLTSEKVENPVPQTERDCTAVAPRRAKSDTPFIIEMILAKRRAPLLLKKELAIRLDADNPNSRHTEKEIEAMAARVRRVSGDGIDRMRPAPKKRRIKPKTYSPQ